MDCPQCRTPHPDGFRIVGPLVMKPEAIWVFMEECGKNDEGRAGTVMGDAPAIPSCRECFLFERKDLTEVAFSGWTGTLKLKTRWIELDVQGVEPKEKASAYLKLRGYPFKG